MFCPKCGAENKDEAKFCKRCGNELKSSNVHEENINNLKENNNVQSTFSQLNNVSKTNNSNNMDSKSKNNNVLIICVTAIICVLIVAGAFLYLSSNGSNDSSSVALDDNNVSDVNNTTDSKSNSSSSSKSSSSSSDVMTYDGAKSYLGGASNTVIRNTFDEADANGDGVLTGSEISRFKYLADLTDRTADTSNTEHVEATDYGAGDGTTKTRYCTTHGRVAVGSDNLCPYCLEEGLDARTVKGSTEYI